MAPIVLRDRLDEPIDVKGLEARPLAVDSALRDAGLLGALGWRAAKQDELPNQLIGALLGPDQVQAYLRPIPGEFTLGTFAGCHVAELRRRMTRGLRSAQDSDLTPILQTCV